MVKLAQRGHIVIRMHNNFKSMNENGFIIIIID